MDQRALIATAALAVAMPARGDELPARSDVDPPTWAAEVRVRNGASKAPFAVREQSRVTSEFTAARLTVLEARWRVRPRWRLGLTLPAAASIVKEPAGAYLEDNAFGTLGLRLEGALIQRRFEELAAGFALGVPLPWHGPEGRRTRNRVLASASAIDLWRDAELYHPGTVPLAWSLRYARRRERVVLGAALKLPVLVRVHDAHLPAERTRAVGFVPSARALARAQWADWFAPYAALQLGAGLPAPDGQPIAASLGGELGLLLSFTPSMHVRALALASMVGALDGTWGFGLDIGYHR